MQSADNHCADSMMIELAKITRGHADVMDFASALVGKIAIRKGEIEPGGAYFATGEGQSCYFDPLSDQALAYDITAVRLVSSDTAEAKQVIAEAFGDKANAPAEQEALENSLDNGYIDYLMNDGIPSIVKAAKKLGYDGIKVWENDSVASPDSVFIWKTNKVRLLGPVMEFYNSENGRS